jgi:hypothetical protein
VKIASFPVVATALVAGALVLGCGSSQRPAVWDYIAPVIMEPNCATGSCHSPGAAVAGLDFSTPDRGYTSLTGLWVWIVDPTKAGQPGCGPRDGTTVCERQYRPLVTPYDPGESRLVNMLRARNAPRMPPDRPLDEADIELVENWILDGAKRYPNGPAMDAGTGDAGLDAPPDGPSDATTDAVTDTTTETITDASTDGGSDAESAE